MSENGERQKFFSNIHSVRSRTDDLPGAIKVNRFMLLSHFLANQIAGKPVRISCHIIMCWYEFDSTVLWVWHLHG